MHRNVGGLLSVLYDEGVAPYELEPGAAEVDILAFPRFCSILRVDSGGDKALEAMGERPG